MWNFLDDGNFSITKNKVPFTAIDPDHGIEQEHKKMKIKGGFTEITGNEHALEKMFIIAPTLSRVVEEFKVYAGIEGRQPSSLHHEVVGTRGKNMLVNAAKIATIISKQGNPFSKTDMFNLMTFAIPTAVVCSNIEERDNLGQQALEKFVSTRMVEKTVKFWYSQTKNKWTYFKDVGATISAKVNGQVVSIKQERKLISRLLVAAKSRSDLDVKDAIGEFEFNVAPPSNFHPNGSMIMLSDKSKVLHSVLGLPRPDVDMDTLETGEPCVLIVDAMCIVNMVIKTPDMTHGCHFARKFVDMVVAMGTSYDEIRIVFDQYLSGSLKETTRDKRTLKTTPIQYHVNDDTDIRNIKTFLSHINTKAELTKYLSDKLINHYRGKPQKVLVMHHTTMEANCPLHVVVDMPEMTSGTHNLEEGDQLVLLNAFDVMHKHPRAKLDVFSIDTDVFVILTALFDMLLKATTFIRKNNERVSIQDSHVRLGAKHALALIGWYAFKRTDNTGSFAGKGILSHFKAFMEVDDDILEAFAAFGLVEHMPDGYYVKWSDMCVYCTKLSVSTRTQSKNSGGDYMLRA